MFGSQKSGSFVREISVSVDQWSIFIRENVTKNRHWRHYPMVLSENGGPRGPQNPKFWSSDHHYHHFPHETVCLNHFKQWLNMVMFSIFFRCRPGYHDGHWLISGPFGGCLASLTVKLSTGSSSPRRNSGKMSKKLLKQYLLGFPIYIEFKSHESLGFPIYIEFKSHRIFRVPLWCSSTKMVCF